MNNDILRKLITIRENVIYCFRVFSFWITRERIWKNKLIIRELPKNYRFTWDCYRFDKMFEKFVADQTNKPVGIKNIELMNDFKLTKYKKRVAKKYLSAIDLKLLITTISEVKIRYSLLLEWMIFGHMFSDCLTIFF